MKNLKAINEVINEILGVNEKHKMFNHSASINFYRFEYFEYLLFLVELVPRFFVTILFWFLIEWKDLYVLWAEYGQVIYT